MFIFFALYIKLVELTKKSRNSLTSLPFSVVLLSKNVLIAEKSTVAPISVSNDSVPAGLSSGGVIVKYLYSRSTPVFIT